MEKVFYEKNNEESQIINDIIKKKELYLQMKREIELAQQIDVQFCKQVMEDDINRPIENYGVDEYDRIEKFLISRH